MSVESQQLENLSEEELKKLLETASDYQERSNIRSILRKIKKSRGEVTENKNADYKRRGHQIEVTKFKLDLPTYYSHIGPGSNLRKEAALNIPKPKHFIPSMMSPMVKRRDSEDMLSSEGSKSSLSTVHSYAERSASSNVEDSNEKDSAIRSHSYGFEQELRQHQSPDLGYPESPDPNSSGQERPSYSSEQTEESDEHTHDKQSEPQAVSPQSPQAQEQDITLTESQLEQASSDASVEPVEQKEHRSNPPTHRSNTEYSSQGSRNVPDAASQKADGELDQLTQKLAYCDNPEEQVQLRKKIRETREVAGRGRMKKHTSFIKIDVKKGSKTESDSSSPQESPSHALDDVDEHTCTPVNNGEERDVSPAELSSSPIDLELDTQDIISNEYSPDEDGNGYPSQRNVPNPYTDLTQLSGEEPLTGRKPRVKADGGIDFTNVLIKSENHLNTKKSPRVPLEQHSFKGVLRKNSPQPNTSPLSTKKTQEATQMDFRNVLTNKVTTNQHKVKSAPIVATKPATKNKRDSPPADEYEESLPQEMVFRSEPLQRSPSPDQLPEPAQPQEHIPVANSNNHDEPTEETTPVSAPDTVAKEDTDSAIQEDEAAIAYRRSSMKTGQDSRKRLRAMHKQNSLSKLRQSITDIDIPTPSGDSIPEEMSRTDPLQEKDSPKIGLVEDPSPVSSPVKPASLERVSAGLAEPEESRVSNYEQRRLERKKKRELSGRGTDDELQSQPVTQRSHTRSKRENGETTSMKSAKDSYLKTAGIDNDAPISRSPTSSPNSHSSRTLNWAKSQTSGYNVEIKDLTHSWKNGLAFCALIHSYLPGEFDFDSLSANNPKQNMDLAFRVAGDYGIPKLFDPEDIIEMHVPDQRSIMTYLSTIYKGLHNQ